MAYNPDSDNMYVTNFGPGDVSVIDAGNSTVIDTITVGDKPHGVAYNPDNTYLYVTNLFPHFLHSTMIH
jgi:YVTN family beta-propeller protein